ncbi:hypothetical protein PMIN01_09828 [Paraphaeosphaeria minitans]|uniref:Uncharacterized protein n=1 Tax=Paraphaeosphaeria minitans TaxID=565426 RepID=A0A9P6GCV7_9PLEO|nr:hypothetical protein PMIN01_09828 [Paraphaeosphaeria minitans]
MGTSSKIDSTFFRLGEVCSAVIVVLLLSHFYINASDDGRLIYTEIISVLEPVFSILLPISTKYSFYAFPLNIIIFICSI